MLQMDVRIPDWMLAGEQEQDKRTIRSVEQPVPWSAIKLVTMIDGEDVICKEVETSATQSTKKKELKWPEIKGRSPRWLTLEDGTRHYIQYPKEDPKSDESDEKDTPADTLRFEVEQKSFLPTLFRPPFPGSVIDELRNKYSVFRTRHDPEYIAKKVAEDKEKQEKQLLVRKMRTPVKEINRLEKKMLKAKGKGKLTEQMLERIGKVIAEKKQLHSEMASRLQTPKVAVA